MLWFTQIRKSCHDLVWRLLKRCTIEGCRRRFVYDLGSNQDKVCREHL